MYRADAYVSSADYKFKRTSPKVDRQPDREDHAMSVLLNAQRQTIDGFGSALTESAASCICALPEEKRQALLDEIYLRAGAAFSMCRLHIGSCDFSLGEYAYTEPEDRDMRTFSFAREDKYVAPVLMEALKRRGDMTLLASPWSAPGWMKTNGDVRHGGSLRDDWRREWGEYVARYIEAWRERGANIAAITVQNEPHASQPWESCVYDARQEAELVTEILRPALGRHGLSDVKVFIWDHNKERVYERARDSFACENARKQIDGVAFHWYSGAHFSGLQAVHEDFPEKRLWLSEFCQTIGTDPTRNFAPAIAYAAEIAGDLNNWTNGVIDWNLALNMSGGPYHYRRSGCLAPVLVDARRGEYYLTGAYYGLSHFSGFIEKGAVRLASSIYDDNIKAVAARNPDGSIACVLANTLAESRKVNIRLGEWVCAVELPGRSIASVVLREE